MKKYLTSISPYTGSHFEEGGIKLNQNESPWDFPATLKKKCFYLLRKAKWSRYPETSDQKLKTLIAQSVRTNPEKIGLSNGLIEMLLSLLHATCQEGDTVIFPAPSYPLYARLSQIAGAKPVQVNLTDKFQLPVAEVIEQANKTNAKMIFIANPNNPTGNLFAAGDILAIAKQVDAYVVVDEAYYDFSQKTLINYIDRYNNLIVLRTLSKLYRLAGLRLGFLVAAPQVVSAIEKIIPPYHVSLFTSVVAQVALMNYDYTLNARMQIIQERERLRTILNKSPNAVAYPSDTNFILVRFKDAAGIQRELVRDKVFVRDVSHFPGLENCLRITIGIQKENNRLLEIIKPYLYRNTQSES